MKILGKVALVGAPSTGKSTIFNRLIQERKSIVSEEHGITRDRIYAQCSWLGRDFMLIDTGGLEIQDVPFQEEIKAQVDLAIEEADVIVFVVDGKTGLTNDDRYVAKLLFRCKDKKIIFVCNKIDNIDQKERAFDFYALGYGEPILVSGLHGIGIGDLLDEIVKDLPNKEIPTTEGKITFALLGRPNVGKSSFTNAILGEQRDIVSPIAGTTRDSIDTPFKRGDKDYVIVDTAGLKKRGKIYESIDKYAALRAMDAIQRADIAILVIDASEGILEQDRHVISIASEADKPIIFLVNKWDLHSHTDDDQKKFTQELQSYFTFASYAPIVFASALYKPNLDVLFEAIDACYEDYTKRVPTSMLNKVLLDAQVMNEAPIFNGGRIRITYATQVKNCPPTFAFFCNNPKYMHFSYQRYLVNVLEENFKLKHTPLKIFLRSKGQGQDKL